MSRQLGLPEEATFSIVTTGIHGLFGEERSQRFGRRRQRRQFNRLAPVVELAPVRRIGSPRAVRPGSEGQRLRFLQHVLEVRLGDSGAGM